MTVIIQDATYTLIELAGKVAIQGITNKAETEYFNKHEALVSQIAKLIKLNTEKRPKD